MKRLPTPLPSPERRREWRRAIAWTLLAFGALPTLPAALAAEATESQDEAEAPAEEVNYRNYVELSAGGTIVNGDPAAMSYRTGLPEGVYGGVSSLHYEADIDENTLFELDGRGIFDNGDYSLMIGVKREDLGYLRGGLSQFRTYYENSGGYLPAGNVWGGNFPDDNPYVETARYWFEAGLRKPDWPEITLRYSHDERNGEKNSTVWGPLTVPPGVTRRITPTFLGIDEERNSVALDAKKDFNDTTVALGFRYDSQETDNTRNERYFPSGGSYMTQREETSTDLWNAHAATQTRFSDELWLNIGYAYTSINADSSGYRVYGTGYDPDFANRIPNADTYDNLAGHSDLSQNVANVNLYWQVADPVKIIPMLRIEQFTRQASDTFGQAAPPAASFPYAASSDRGLLDVAGAVEVRYDGVTNLVVFARGDWLTGSGNLDESRENLFTGFNDIARSTDDEHQWQKYTLGANWYAHRRFSLGAGYYWKDRRNDFDNYLDNTPNNGFARYPAYLVAQRYTLNDVNARATWRPRNNLTLTGRYDLQLGEMESQVDGLAEVQTTEITSSIVSGSVSWVPLARLYVQAQGSYIADQTTSPLSSSAATVANSDNNYWTAGGSVGVALSNEVDLHASYTYYQADNFEGTQIAGVPYGASLRENWVNAALTWRMNPRVRWLLSYGYGSSDDESSGGYDDFDVHIVNGSMQYRF